MTESAPLSLFEAAQLFYIALGTQDRFFEFWISATFAVIMACHLGSHSLTRSFSVLMSVLYIAFSVNMLTRWQLASSAVFRFRSDMLAISGVDGRFQLIELSRTLTLVTLIAGTAVTLFFIWFTLRHRKEVD